MAYTKVSKDYEQIIYSGGAKNQLKVSFNGIELENADYYFEKLVRKGRIIPNGNKGFYLDNFISQTIEATIHDIDLDKIVEPVNISIGTLVNNVYELVPLGTFNIQDKNKADNDRIILKLEDNAKKFDFNYNGKELIDANGGKVTKKQILNDICNKAGVKTKVTTFIGENDEVSTYDNTIKARKYISLLAEQGGGIATIDRDGDLIFVYLNDLHKHKIPLSIVEKYDKGQDFKVSRVLFEDGVRKFEQGNKNNDTIFINANNPYINSQEQINQIYDKVKDFKIDSLTTGKIYGNPTIDSYDLIEIYDDYDIFRLPINYTLKGVSDSIRIGIDSGEYILSWSNVEFSSGDKALILFFYDDDTTKSVYVDKNIIEKNVVFTLDKHVRKTKIYSSSGWEASQNTTTIFSHLMLKKGNKEIPLSTTLATNELTYKGNMIANYKTTIEISDKRENMSLKPSVATLKRYVNSEIDQVNASIKLQAGEIDKNTSKISSLEVGINGINGSVSSLSTKVNNNYQDIIKRFDDVASTDDLENYQSSMQVQIDSNKAQITSTEQLIANGVPKVNTSTGKFDINGLTMDRNGAKTSTLLNEIGVDVKDKQGTGEDLLFAGYVDKKKANENARLKKYEGQTVTYSNNMIVDNYFEIGNNSRLQDYEDGTGVFVIGGY